MIYLEAPTIAEMKADIEDIPKDNIVEFNASKHEMEIELIFTVGGDGTILWTVNYFPNRAMPPVFTIDRVLFKSFAVWLILVGNAWIHVQLFIENISRNGEITHDENQA